jgi:hypothetical protein
MIEYVIALYSNTQNQYFIIFMLFDFFIHARVLIIIIYKTKQKKIFTLINGKWTLPD